MRQKNTIAIKGLLIWFNSAPCVAVCVALSASPLGSVFAEVDESADKEPDKLFVTVPDTDAVMVFAVSDAADTAPSTEACEVDNNDAAAAVESC